MGVPQPPARRTFATRRVLRGGQRVLQRLTPPSARRTGSEIRARNLSVKVAGLRKELGHVGLIPRTGTMTLEQKRAQASAAKRYQKRVAGAEARIGFWSGRDLKISGRFASGLDLAKANTKLAEIDVKLAKLGVKGQGLTGDKRRKNWRVTDILQAQKEVIGAEFDLIGVKANLAKARINYRTQKVLNHFTVSQAQLDLLNHERRLEQFRRRGTSDPIGGRRTARGLLTEDAFLRTQGRVFNDLRASPDVYGAIFVRNGTLTVGEKTLFSNIAWEIRNSHTREAAVPLVNGWLRNHGYLRANETYENIRNSRNGVMIQEMLNVLFGARRRTVP